MKIREQLKYPPDRLYHSTSMLILGKPGSGKTRLGSTVGRMSFDEPCPLLILDQDNGATAQRFSNPALIAESFNEVRTLLERIAATVQRQDGPYEMNYLGRTWNFSGVMIDTINRLQDVIRKEIKGGHLSDKPIRLNDYGILLDKLLGTLLYLKELSETKPFHLVITAQIAPDKIAMKRNANIKDDDTDGVASSYYWLPNLSGSISNKLPEHLDLVLTSYFDPTTGQYTVYGKDTVTDLGTFAGKMKFGHFCKPLNPSIVPATWWDILKLHQVDLAHPDKIGALDITKEVEVHWAEDMKNRETMAGILAKDGVPIEALFEACGAEGWDGLSSYAGTGKDALKAAKELHETRLKNDAEMKAKG